MSTPRPEPIIVKRNPFDPREWIVQDGKDARPLRYTCREHAEQYARWRAGFGSRCEVRVITDTEEKVIGADEVQHFADGGFRKDQR